MNRETNKWFSKLGMRYFLISIINCVIQVAGIAVFGVIDGITGKEISDSYTLLVMMLPMYIIGTPIIMKLFSGISAKKIPKGNFSVKKAAAVFCISYAAAYLGNIVGQIVNGLLASMADKQAVNVASEMISSGDVWQNLIVTVIAAPLFEELLFRKILVDRTVKYGEGTAIVLSGVLFGLYHGNIVQFTYATILGMIFAYVYVKSGKLSYTIVLHMLINLFGSIVDPFVFSESNLEALSAMSAGGTGEMSAAMAGIIAVYFIIKLVIVIAGIILFILNVKKINLIPGNVQIEKGKRFRTVFVNVGMILYSLLWIGMMVFTILGLG